MIYKTEFFSVLKRTIVILETVTKACPGKAIFKLSENYYFGL